MPRKKVKENPYYTKIIILILLGHNTSKQIRFIINKDLDKNHSAHLTPSNLSMKIQQLRNLGLLSVTNLKSINHSSTRRYSVNYEGFVRKAIDELIPNLLKENKDYLGLPYMKRLAEYFERYLKTSLLDKRFHSLHTIKLLMENWIKGIGIRSFNPNSIRTNNKKPYDNWDEWDLFMQLSIECRHYLQKTDPLMMVSAHSFQ